VTAAATIGGSDPSDALEQRLPPVRSRVWRAIRSQPAPLLAGLVILAPFLFISIFPGLVAPHGPLKIETLPLLSPRRDYLLGTDEVGRDLLSRCVHAARADILVSLAAAFVAFVVGVAIGLFSGYVGGRTDTVTMRLVDVLLSFPTIVLALFLITIFGRERWVQILAIALVMMPSTARFSRGEGLVLRGRGYVEASRISGASRFHILRKHVLPNSLPTLLVAASVLASSAVLISASLSYLGLGAQPPEPSWGNMLRSAYGVVYDAPLYGIGPGVCISLVAGAYILIGEGLRRKFRSDRNIGSLGSIGGV
jgi:ABC-type dipeptide/oligopeptide/nickel transport system permease subunit